jgi:hypothetical protein
MPSGVSGIVGAVGRRSDSIFCFNFSRPALYSAPTKPSSINAFHRFSGLEPDS